MGTKTFDGRTIARGSVASYLTNPLMGTKTIQQEVMKMI